MSFYNVAINDGCMAGLGLQRDFVVGFYLGEPRALFRLYDKADIFQMLAPAAAAASARGLVNLDRWQRPVISQKLRGQQRRQSESQCCQHQYSEHH